MTSITEAALGPSDDALLRRVRRNDTDALNQLIDRHGDLLRRKVDAFSRAPVPASVLHAQAIKMLRLSAERFKPTKGAAFRTFLDHNVRLTRFANAAKGVARIPEHRALMIRRFTAAREALRADRDREPTATELAEDLGWSVNDVTEMETALSRRSLAGSGMEFDQVAGTEDRFAETAEFLYFSLTPQEQLVWDFSLGRHGKPKLASVAEIAARSGLTTDRVYAIKRDLAAKLTTAR